MTKDEDIRKVQDAIRAGDMENCDAYRWTVKKLPIFPRFLSGKYWKGKVV